MAIVMVVLGLSLNVRGPSTQVAAAQVASGLSLARQIAVSRNAETRFVVYGATNGPSAAGLPQESWRYWTIIRSNRDVPGNVWVMEKEWEKLPNGVVFLNIASGNYSTINIDPIGATVGTAFAPMVSTNLGGGGNEWKGFDSFGTFNVASPASPATTAFTLTQVPAIGYRGAGEAVMGDGKSLPGAQAAAAVRVVDGAVTPDAKILLKTTNNYYYVETDKRGRVRVRARESYR